MTIHHLARPARRVPVEHRWFGMDRRSFPTALAVIAVFLVATVLIPRIDRSIGWDDPVEPGQQLLVAENIAFTPVAGWNVVSGFRLGAASTQTAGPATVVNDGVTFSVTADAFQGSPRALLRQIDKVTSATGNDPSFQTDDDPVTVTTRAGDVGVLQSYHSINGDGLIAAFVLKGTGVQVTAYGPPEQMKQAAGDLTDMLASVGPLSTSGGPA